MRLEPYLDQKHTLILEGCASLSELLGRLADHAATSLEPLTRDELLEALQDRERRFPTSTPEGVAFPHAILDRIEDTFVIAASVRPAVSFGVKGHPDADIVFCMFGNAADPFTHVRLLARLARIANAPGALDRLRRAADAGDLHSILLEEDRSHG